MIDNSIEERADQVYPVGSNFFNAPQYMAYMEGARWMKEQCERQMIEFAVWLGNGPYRLHRTMWYSSLDMDNPLYTQQLLEKFTHDRTIKQSTAGHL